MKCRNTHEPASLALKQRKEMQKKNAVTLDFIAQELRGCWDPWGQLLDAHQYQKLWLVWPPFAHSIERVPYLEWWSIFLWMGTPLRTLRHHTVGPMSMDWHSSLARNKPRNCLHQTWARWGGQHKGLRKNWRISAQSGQEAACHSRSQRRRNTRSFWRLLE